MGAIMGSFNYKGRRYYTTRREAEQRRRKGERIYFARGLGYYIVRPQSNSWW